MPIPKWLKDLYYFIFDTYFREYVESFFKDLFEWVIPALDLKSYLHIYCEYLIQDKVYKHFGHVFIITIFNYPWSIAYILFIWFLFLLKDDYCRCYYYYIGRYRFEYIDHCRIIDAVILNEIHLNWYKQKKIDNLKEFKYKIKFKTIYNKFYIRLKGYKRYNILISRNKKKNGKFI